MNIWRITLKELLTFRDFKLVGMMLGTPVLLTLILGTALSGSFNETIKLEDIRVLYKLSSTEPALADRWETFVEEAGLAGIDFEPAEAQTDGVQEVELRRYIGYAEITDDGLRYYANSRSGIEGDIAMNMLTTFAGRTNLADAIDAGGAEPTSPATDGGGVANYVQAAPLDADRQPGAMDYYAIAMLTLTIMYFALTAAQLFDIERSSNTAARLLAAPVTKGEIFAGKIIGNWLLNAILIVFVVYINQWMFGVYWGEQLWLVFIVLFSQVVFAISLGIGFGFLMNSKTSGMVIMFIIQIGAFIGGSYFPIYETTGIMRTLTQLSPLQWTNDALLEIIFGGNASAAGTALLLNIGWSVLLLAAAAIIMRRREGL